jgi:hypothetical protein
MISLPSLRRAQVIGDIITSKYFPFRGNPSLRYLDGIFGRIYSPQSISGASVQHLDVWAMGDHWSDGIRHLGHTLVALKIWVDKDSPASAEAFDLPHLRYLEIRPRLDEPNRWEFKASTPLLQSHVPLRMRDSNGTLYHYTEVDVGDVTHLELALCGSLSLAPYHRLHYLRTRFHPVEIIEQLRRDDQLCPSLTLIEYNDDKEFLNECYSLDNGEVLMAEVITTIDRSHSGTPGQISVVHIPFWSPWSVKLPNAIEDTVGASVYHED